MGAWKGDSVEMGVMTTVGFQSLIDRNFVRAVRVVGASLFGSTITPNT